MHMERKTTSDFHPEVLRLFDRYVHGLLDRRGFLEGAGKYAVAGTTAVGLLEALSPNYAFAEQIPKDDKRIKAEYVTYDSPQGYGKVRGYLVKPANASGKLPGVLVVHENRGLNPYIEDVARRAAVANFVAFAPDGLTPLGGYPGTDEKGVEMQRSLDAQKLMNDFEAATRWLQARSDVTGKVGVVGFCYGGSVSNQMAVRVSNLAAAAPFYGGQPRAEDVPKINAPLLLHYAGNDQRINAGWPAYEEALKANNKKYQAYIYEGCDHGFHNDTTPRYNEAAAKLAWQRTIEFFDKNLRNS
jgi:carboxymethylenebutenolidase